MSQNQPTEKAINSVVPIISTDVSRPTSAKRKIVVNGERGGAGMVHLEGIKRAVKEM
jgi:hypothetical protein